MNTHTKLSSFHVSLFRRQELAWITLCVFLCSFMPSISLAQQPTATIDTFTGTVLVNGVSKGQGAMLQAGDTIDTAEGSTVVLRLSDESLLEIQENTRVDLAVLLETPTGARMSRIKLLWGRIRAKLSGEHQSTGSTFDIETRNALVGVKFSQPDVEVSYESEKNETQAFAHTVDLNVRNFLTNEQVIVPAGSMAIITVLGIKIMTIAAAGVAITEMAGTKAAETAATDGLIAGMSKTTMIAVGAGALVGVGGLAALTGGGGNGDGESGTTGYCDQEQVAGENIAATRVIELGRSSGTFQFYYDSYAVPDRMVVEYEGSVLFDTGCVGDYGSVYLSYSGRSSRVTVRVTPNCAGTSYTAWEFTVFCPM